MSMVEISAFKSVEKSSAVVNGSRFSTLRPSLSLQLLWQCRELVMNMLARELVAQFKGSFLGLTWVFARPLLVLLVYTFVFGVLWPHDGDGLPLGAFAMTMFCGLALYNIFSVSISGSCNTVLGHVGFVKQVVFPLETLPFVHVLTQFVFGFAWLLLLYAGVWAVFGHLPLTSLMLPAVMFPLFVISTGLAWLVSSLTVYLRDLKQLVPVVMQMLFFLTPVFWQLDALQGSRARYVPYLYLNPLTGVVEALRDILIRGRQPDWRMLGLLSAVGVVVWYLGFAWFNKTKKGFADVI